jgi:protein TonB
MTTRREPATLHRRLTGFILLSVLVHALFWGWRSTALTMALAIPASELAVSLSTQPQHTPIAHRIPEAIPDSRPAVATRFPITPPLPAVSTFASASDAVTNHLQSLLHDSLSRHFVYPAMARRLGWEGRVELRVCLDPEGRVYGLRVLQSSGYPLLDEDAVLTLQRIGSIPLARTWLPKQGYATTLPVIYKLNEG